MAATYISYNTRLTDWAHPGQKIPIQGVFLTDWEW
jgi:hypothetical protein